MPNLHEHLIQASRVAFVMLARDQRATHNLLGYRVFFATILSGINNSTIERCERYRQ